MEKMLHCNQESRITRLEAISDKREEEINLLNESITKLTNEIVEMNKSLVGVESTFASLKYIISLAVAIFGGIFVFLTIELIKLI